MMRPVMICIMVIAGFTAKAQDTLSYSSFTTEQYKAWKEIEATWHSEKFHPFLKRNNIRLNCSDCPSVFAWVTFKRDSLGTNYTILKSSKCGKELSEKLLKQFKGTLGTIVLPEEFKNKIIKVHLGSVLKC